MACKRNRSVALKEYLKTLGVDVNIGKTKARGNKGIFICGQEKYRIDISKDLPDEKILPVICHEFAHFVHYTYDSSLKTLDFVFEDMTDENWEELVNITVKDIPKDFAANLYSKKDELNQEIKSIASEIKKSIPDFKISSPYKLIEKRIKAPVKYLLSYDRVRVLNQVYSIENLTVDFPELSKEEYLYIILKSKQRAVSRINSRIAKLNRYYNKPTELFARFCELYFTDKIKSQKIAPELTQRFNQIISSNNIPEFTGFSQVISKFA